MNWKKNPMDAVANVKGWMFTESDGKLQ